MSNEQSAPAEWPTDDMVVRGAEELHDSLRMFGIDINFDTKTKGTEIQQEIVEAVFNAMIAAAPKAEQQPVQDITYWSIQVEKRLCEKLGKPWQASGMSIETLIDELAAAPQPVSDDARDAARYRWLREQHNEVCSDIGVYDGENILRGEFSDLDLDYSIDAVMGSNGDD